MVMSDDSSSSSMDQYPFLASIMKNLLVPELLDTTLSNNGIGY